MSEDFALPCKDISSMAEQILIRKASGYEYSEVTDEYCPDKDGALALIKRKVSSKYVPPDISALKALITLKGGGEFSHMSDEELEKEKRRLLEALAYEKEEKSHE